MKPVSEKSHQWNHAVFVRKLENGWWFVCPDHQPFPDHMQKNRKIKHLKRSVYGGIFKGIRFIEVNTDAKKHMAMENNLTVSGQHLVW